LSTGIDVSSLCGIDQRDQSGITITRCSQDRIAAFVANGLVAVHAIFRLPITHFEIRFPRRGSVNSYLSRGFWSRTQCRVVPDPLKCAVAKQKLNKKLAKSTKPTNRGLKSPFRYAGGKSWFIKIAAKWMANQKDRPKLLVEPFAGGANISLSAVFANLVDKAEFSELDRDVAATWKSMLNGHAGWLAEKVLTFPIGRRNVLQHLERKPSTQHERAFLCLLRNRTARGGVIAEGAGLIRKGEDGMGVRSRWYPKTISDRIDAISKFRGKLGFFQCDGFRLIQKHKNKKTAFFFVDPPYTKAARRLYRHWDIDHEHLFRVLQQVKGDVLMTYDDTREVRGWAKKYGFQVKTIAMRTTHHATKRELMISKGFGWLNTPLKPKRRASTPSDNN
jgi:DNA adenine methylase